MIPPAEAAQLEREFDVAFRTPPRHQRVLPVHHHPRSGGPGHHAPTNLRFTTRGASPRNDFFGAFAYHLKLRASVSTRSAGLYQPCGAY